MPASKHPSILIPSFGSGVMLQTEIAARIGVDNRASISGYERGEREPPLPTLLAYARLAGVAMECLVDDKMKLPDR